MAKLRQLRFNPEDPRSIADALTELQKAVQSELSFGDPIDPNDDASTVLAGDTTASTPHNGVPGNVFGAWVEMEFTAVDTATTATHNLGIPVTGTDEPNVRWLVMGIRHSGAGTPDAISINYEDNGAAAGDTITADSIQLRAYSAARTVNGANPIRVSLFFTPVTRWPD